MQENLAKNKAIKTTAFIIGLLIAITLNSIVSAAIYWIVNALFGTVIELTITNSLIGGAILSALNLVIYKYRGDKK